MQSLSHCTRPRTLAKHHEKQTELQQLVTRRRQLNDLRTAENNRQELPTSKLVQKSIQKIIDMLQKQIKSIEKEIAKLLDSDDHWKDKAEIIESIPGVGNDLPQKPAPGLMKVGLGNFAVQLE